MADEGGHAVVPLKNNRSEGFVKVGKRCKYKESTFCYLAQREIRPGDNLIPAAGAGFRKREEKGLWMEEGSSKPSS